VASRLGDVIAYADEKDGSLIQDVAPVEAAGNRQENTATVCLELHTEDGFHPFKPDYVTLLCLRPDRERTAQTLIGSVSRVLPLLTEECLRTLRRPLFQIKVSTSFGHSPQQRLSAPLPVLSGPARGPAHGSSCATSGSATVRTNPRRSPGST
jgi:L-asparagine oxygenase